MAQTMSQAQRPAMIPRTLSALGQAGEVAAACPPAVTEAFQTDAALDGSSGPPGPTATSGRARAGRAASANHLLNFQPYSSGGRGPAAARGGAAGGGRRGSGRAPANRNRSQHAHRPQRYDRNQFLQANFRFLVSDAVESSRFVADPDLMFEWEDVVQVEMLSTAPIQCPISLDSPPVCPQITPCGHVFSFASIVQHLQMHGGKRCSTPCPLCFTPLVARELRLVHIRLVSGTPTPGAVQAFQLLKRSRASILPQPVAPRALLSAPAQLSDASAPAAAEGKPGTSAASSLGAATTSSGPGVAHSSSTAGASGLQGNVFAKFALTSDATPLWRDAARELAAYAAEVTSEGGTEAAIVAPFIYAALDSLAFRARRWTERRAESLSSRGLLLQTTGLSLAQQEAEVARLGAEAEAVVKGMFTAATTGSSGTQQQERKGAAANGPSASLPATDNDPFPALGPSRAAMVPPAPPPRVKSDSGSQQQQQQQQGKAAQVPRLQQAVQQPQLQQQQARHLEAPEEEGDESGDEGHEVEGDGQSEMFGGEFRFEAAFSDDEPITDQGAGPVAGRDGGQGDVDDDAEGQGQVSAGQAEQGRDSFDGVGGSGGSPRAGQRSEGGPRSEALMGTSPNTTLMNAPNQRDEYFMYQAADGTWVFLHPLNLRCLLAHYGTYEACPAVLQAPVLELEDVVQCEATRKRLRFLGHLPATATFKLAEVDMTGLLPAEALNPFAEELAGRERRRKRKAAQTRRAAEKEAADARAAEAAKRGPSAQELKAMPQLRASSAAASIASGPGTSQAQPLSAQRLGSSAEDSALQAAIEASLADPGAGLIASSPPGGVGWAHLVKMGYAATGPTLGSSPPSSSAGGGPAPVQQGMTPLGQVPQPTGVWANKGAAIAAAAAPKSGSGFAGWGARSGSSATGVAGVSRSSSTLAVGGAGAGASAANLARSGQSGSQEAAGASEALGKAKAKKGTLLFTTTAQRRY